MLNASEYSNPRTQIQPFVVIDELHCALPNPHIKILYREFHASVESKDGGGKGAPRHLTDMILLLHAESNTLLLYLYFPQVSIVSTMTSRCVVDLIKEANDLPRHVFPPRLLVVHDTG